MSLKLIIVRIIYLLSRLQENPTKLFRELGVESSGKILEIGCAIGYHMFPLADIASKGKIYAVDIWEEGLTYLKSKIRPSQNIDLNAETVEFPPSSLDKIVCFDTLHELSNFEQAIERWTVFLKEGGKFYYRDPTIPPSKIQEVAPNKLDKIGTIKEVHIFLRKSS